MSTEIATAPLSKSGVWTARAMSGLAIVFFAMDAGIHIAKPTPVVEAFEKLGYPIGAAVGIGLLELICLITYVIPRTAILGAVLITGVLGGAVSTQLRAGGTPFETYIFPFIVGVLVWGSLWLRDSRLRDVLPVRR